MNYGLLLTLSIVASVGSTPWMTVDFDGPPPFAVVWSGGSRDLVERGPHRTCGPGASWTYTHFPSGGWSNRGYVEYRWCNSKISGRNMGPSGWTGRGSDFRPGDGWPTTFYGRLRLYPVTGIIPTANGDRKAQFKWFMWHTFVYDGDQRVIGFLESGSNCGKRDSTHVCFTLQRNIHHSSDTSTAALPVGRWAHLQFSWRHGVEGESFLKVWVNSNAEHSPTAQDTRLNGIARHPRGTSEWAKDDAGYNGQFFLGNMANTGTLVKEDFVVRMMDFQLDGRFNSAWTPASDAATR